MMWDANNAVYCVGSCVLQPIEKIAAGQMTIAHASMHV